MTHPAIVIIGSTGMLGCELLAACRNRGLEARGLVGPDEIDITDDQAVQRLFAGERPSVVINATGYTDVDGAEAESQAADQINRVGPGHLARACREARALLVHYSTDYIFDGRSDRPYRPGDTPNPVNAYGRSKLAGEREIMDVGCRHLIIRASWLFAPHSRNFVRTILDLAAKRPALDVVDDQCGRPTYAPDLASMTLQLLDHGAEGTVHAANDGQCTWFELASAIVERSGLSCRVRPCTTADMPRPAARPKYSVLDLEGTVALVGTPRHWTEALADCLERLTGDGATRPAPDAKCGA
ncbi:MAG: dTDP-4-dehydrorhamnose reductase [Planctomycetota bacterium]|jgi:dTDP-4-dehydrorhamnose reductase